MKSIPDILKHGTWFGSKINHTGVPFYFKRSKSYENLKFRRHFSTELVHSVVSFHSSL